MGCFVVNLLLSEVARFRQTMFKALRHQVHSASIMQTQAAITKGQV